MDAHGSRLLGDDSFGHPRQLLKWMVLRVSPILGTAHYLSVREGAAKK